MVRNAPEGIAGLAVAVLSASGYLGLFGLMAVESTGLPVPSEIVLPFAGYLTAEGRLNLWVVACMGALGCGAGSQVAYEIGRRFGLPVLHRWGPYVLITHNDIERGQRFFERFGAWAVLIARLLPVLRGVISYPAGAARMDRGKFQVCTLIGSWPWCLLLAWAGRRMGADLSDGALQRLFHWLDWGAAACAVVFIAWFVWRGLGRRQRGPSADDRAP